ncbi:hypothetical protein BD309DRAFT_953371 [Dichomitus squalens]|uniref:Uncharacterized protein n=1 Tax=Dichomitus squalens TaxID=114155 RepID=A0A4Q9NZZ8_9APHY|nr:hypothetical protein BD311DRAFT_754399 [Dichomitus squalens]TBU46765.1 hypothetical protein BD309DRAFT_953371 [Dichomitus squalens]
MDCSHTRYLLSGVLLAVAGSLCHPLLLSFVFFLVLPCFWRPCSSSGVCGQSLCPALCPSRPFVLHILYSLFLHIPILIPLSSCILDPFICCRCRS